MRIEIKILMVSWTVLPWPSGSSFIVEKLAQNFIKDELTILGGKGIFRKIKGNVPNRGVNYYYSNTEINILGRGARFFNLIRWCLFPLLVLKLLWVIKKEKCNYVIGVFPDNFFCMASLVAASIMKTPFSSYFHNTYVENRAGFNAKFAQYIQHKIFSNSEYIFVMSEGMKSFYFNKYEEYKHKFESLVHTFNQYPNLKIESSVIKPEKSGETKLVLVGNFNASNIDATCKLIESLGSIDNLNIHVYTQLPKILMKTKGIPVDKIIYEGFINDQELVKELQKYDVCVLTHGFKGGYSDIEYETIFPTRTIPFLLSNKPIFALAPENSFLCKFLKESNCAFVITERDSTNIKTSFDKFYKDEALKMLLVENAKNVVKMFYGSDVKKKLLSKIYSK